jgi:hypothetical protein
MYTLPLTAGDFRVDSLHYIISFRGFYFVHPKLDDPLPYRRLEANKLGAFLS